MIRSEPALSPTTAHFPWLQQTLPQCGVGLRIKRGQNGHSAWARMHSGAFLAPGKVPDHSQSAAHMNTSNDCIYPIRMSCPVKAISIFHNCALSSAFTLRGTAPWSEGGWSGHSALAWWQETCQNSRQFQSASSTLFQE